MQRLQREMQWGWRWGGQREQGGVWELEGECDCCGQGHWTDHTRKAACL